MRTFACNTISARQSFFNFLLLVACVGLLSGFIASPAHSANPLELYYQNYKELSQKYDGQISDLLARAKQADDQELEAQIGKRLDLLRSQQSQTTKHPRAIQPKLSRDLPPNIQELHFRYQNISEDYANDLYSLAAKALKSPSPTFGFQLINLTLIINPDHTKARSMRGYIRQGNEWMTPFERDQLRSAKVKHPRFGWIKKSYVERYEAGERFINKNWVSATKEAEIRRDFSKAWVIRTEHFQIKTNHSLEKGVELGKKLEIYHDYFKQTFAAFYNSPQQIRKLLEPTTGRAKTQSQLYEVNYFRNKEEYVAKLIKRVPRIAQTNGLYQLEDRVSYFYFDPNVNNDATVFHEATHQLMYESHLKSRDIARNGHFWIVEGIACYAESFRIIPEGDNFTYEIGAPQFIRFYWARKRLLEEGYFVTLQKFSRMGMTPYQDVTVPQLQKRYSQASGFTHFFMHYKNGLYRNALMNYMAQIYHSSPKTQQSTRGMDHHTGVSYPALDLQYREYIQDQQIKFGKLKVIQ
ncbi:MAG: DUF1570 domain-containing protein [Planctomycetaceae bacterium]|nr:DUF1570 domain-containing protein [Planctomycetaceae bacterium]